MNIKTPAILCLAVLAVGSIANRSLKYVGLGKGANLEESGDFGANWRSVFSGEQMEQRCDIIQAPFYAYCTSPFISLDRSGNCWGVTITTSNIYVPNGAWVGYLATKYFNTIRTSGSNEDAQMFQAVLWELISESTSSYDLTTGSFLVRNSGGGALSGSQLAVANSFLSDVGVGLATVYAADENDGHKVSQDLIVPEPAAVSGLAVWILALVRRRSRNA